MKTTRKGKILQAIALSKNVIEYYVRCKVCKLEYHMTISSDVTWTIVDCPNCKVELEFELFSWQDKLKQYGIFSKDDLLRHGYEGNPSVRNVVKCQTLKMNIIG